MTRVGIGAFPRKKRANRGQVFSLDLVISLVIFVLVISFSTVIIDQAMQLAGERLEHAKMQTIASDIATYYYYNGKAPTVEMKAGMPGDSIIPNLPKPPGSGPGNTPGYFQPPTGLNPPLQPPLQPPPGQECINSKNCGFVVRECPDGTRIRIIRECKNGQCSNPSEDKIRGELENRCPKPRHVPGELNYKVQTSTNPIIASGSCIVASRGGYYVSVCKR